MQCLPVKKVIIRSEEDDSLQSSRASLLCSQGPLDSPWREDDLYFFIFTIILFLKIYYFTVNILQYINYIEIIPG
jgi:hypothetical protein